MVFGDLTIIFGYELLRYRFYCTEIRLFVFKKNNDYISIKLGIKTIVTILFFLTICAKKRKKLKYFF
jgi:hypothetical protein